MRAVIDDDRALGIHSYLRIFSSLMDALWLRRHSGDLMEV